MDTPVRVMTFNGRRSDLPETRVSRYWVNRRKPTINYLKKVAPHIIGVQEFTNRMRDDVVYGSDGLGESWLHIGDGHNVRLLIDTRHFTPVNGTSHYLVLPSDLRKRYALFCQLQSWDTGEIAWFVSAHLASGGVTERNPSRLRHEQMRLIGLHTQGLSGPRDKIILMADLNSGTGRDPDTLRRGTRGIADDYGLFCIRRRLLVEDIRGESYESKHDWSVSEQNYNWIDDVLTTSAVKVHRAVIYRTSADIAKPAYGGLVSDHSGIVTELSI